MYMNDMDKRKHQKVGKITSPSYATISEKGKSGEIENNNKSTRDFQKRNPEKKKNPDLLDRGHMRG